MGKKLTAQDLERYKTLLERLKQQLTGDIVSLESEALPMDGARVSVDDPADNGSDSFAQEFSLELLKRDEDALVEIDKALDRIAAGTYGRCESCEQWIRKGRLGAVPHARLCVDCQRLEESEA